MTSFEVKGLEEFKEKLKTVERKAPDRIINELDRQGNKLRKASRENTPVGKTGKLKKSYKLNQVEKVRGGYSKGMRNADPKHHLVNNGHRKVSPSGKALGWTDGLFYIEKTVSEQEPIIMGELKEWLGEMFQELK